MRPKDLYARTPESFDHDISILKGCYYDHIPEVLAFDLYNAQKQNRIKLHHIKWFNFDGRRYWRLTCVFMDGIPVMIIRNAGREGDDHSSRFITNRLKYLEMVRYIHTLLPIDPEGIEADLVDPEQDIPKLEEFYGNSLDGYFGIFY